MQAPALCRACMSSGRGILDQGCKTGMAGASLAMTRGLNQPFLTPLRPPAGIFRPYSSSRCRTIS